MAPQPGSAAIDPTLLDETHDPRVRSWVDSANRADCEFPIQNLPFAVFRRADGAEEFRGGGAIGGQIVDLAALDGPGLFDAAAPRGSSARRGTSPNSPRALLPRGWVGRGP